MAKKPEKVTEDVTLERTVFIPGWAYNYMIERAVKARRDVKGEISLLLESAIRKEMLAEGKEPGKSLPELQELR